MQTITIRAHVGHDRLLRVAVPVEAEDQDVEAVIVIHAQQPTPATGPISPPDPDYVNPYNPATLEEWLEMARQSGEELLAKYGPDHFNTQEIIDEIREEASEWPRKS